jgi:hypothetical protein
MLRTTFAIAVTLLAAPALAQSTAETSKAQAEIWAKERQIYEGRTQGSLSFYVDNTAPHFLGWPPTVAKPFDRAHLQDDSRRMSGKTKEKLSMELAGFTLEGGTAVIYYTNHRTARPDGTATDETFENIHVWTKVDGDWRVVGALSRLVPKKVP